MPIGAHQLDRPTDCSFRFIPTAPRARQPLSLTHIPHPTKQMDQTLDMRNIPSIGLAKLSFQLIPQLSAGTAVQCEYFLTIARLTNVKIRLLKYRIWRYMSLNKFLFIQ